ncbi:MAG: hypothetical protein ACTSYT_05495 [Candidatus Asgardarchaeia archaeon]
MEFEIEYLKLIFNNILVPVEFKKDLDEELDDYIKRISKRKNRKIYLPLFAARILSNKGLAEISENYVKDLTSVYKYFYREKESPRLQEIPENFFIILREKINEIKEENKLNPDRNRMTMEQKLISFLNEYIDVRSNKIFKCLQILKKEGILENLTLEERWLYEMLYRFYKEWKGLIFPE